MRRLLGKLSLSLSLSLSLDIVRYTHLESNNKGAGSKTTRVSSTTKVTAAVGQLRNKEEEEGRGWVRGPQKKKMARALWRKRSGKDGRGGDSVNFFF
jgi:hypothetical protein